MDLNGTYHYIAVTKSGIMTEGDIVIDFFSPEEYIENNPSNANENGEELVQTGIEGYTVLILALILLVVGTYFYKRSKKGE